MAEQKMTRKQMFQHIAEYMSDEQEVVDFCAHQIELLEKAAARPRRKADPKPELVQFRNDVFEYVEKCGEEVPAKEVADTLGVSTQKASAALRALVKDGRLVAVDNGRKAKTYLVA